MNSQRTIKPRNSLFVKGVLLILVPCIVNSVFIFCLNRHWQKTAQAALATEQRLKVMLTLNDAFDSFLTFGYDVLTNTFRGTRSAQHGNEFLSAKPAANSKIESLPPEAKSLLKVFEEITHDLESLIESVDKTNLHDSRSRFNTFAHILKKACVSGSQLDTMLLDQTNASTLNAASDRRLSADAFSLFIIAVVVEIVLGLLAFIFFIRTVVRRLRNLANNAALLEQWSELPALGGADEFSYLNTVFKDAGGKLKAETKFSEELKEDLNEAGKDLVSKVKLFFTEVGKHSPSFGQEQRRVFEQWQQSAQCALSRLQAFLSVLVPDKRSRILVGTRKGTTDLSPVDLFELVQSCFKELAPLAEIKEVSLVNNCEPKTISARRDKLTLVLMKYLVNSLKNAPAQSEIQVSQSIRDNAVVVSIKDSGTLLSTSSQKQIFNDATNGLYLCKVTLENEGGKFGAKAAGKAGNEFWFSLPVVAPKIKSIFSINELIGSGADSGYRKQKYIFQSGLFRKAALIVFVPMSVHLMLFAWMGYQLGSLQSMIDRGHKEESLTFTVSSLWLNSFLANSSAAIFLTTRDKAYYDAANEHVNRVDEAIKLLKDSGDLNENELSMILETSEFATSQSQLVRHGLSDSTPESINATLKTMPTMFNRSAHLSDELNHLMGVESHKTHEATTEQVHLQDTVEKLVYAGIFCNFLMAFCCLYYFIVSFSNRVNGLVVEAGMVSDGHALPVSTDWNDEIDQIQGFLALASKNAELSKQAESAARILAALEITSPLDTLDALFEVIEAVRISGVDNAGDLVDAAKSSLHSAYERVDILMDPENGEKI